MSRIKSAEIRFYFDADILGLAHILVRLRSDVTYPGDAGGLVHRRQRPPCPITTVKTEDDVWIPEVTKRGWLIITRDSKIQLRRREFRPYESTALAWWRCPGMKPEAPSPNWRS